MKTTSYLFSTLLLITLGAKAQTQFTNPGMETWEQKTAGAHTYNDPAGWYTLNELGQFGISNSTLKSTDAHSGTSAAQLTTVSSPFGAVPGLLTISPIIDATGEPNLDLNFIPFTNRPNSIQFWFKSFPETNDLNAMYCLLSKWNATTKSRDTIGFASWEMDSTISTYTLALVNFEYSSTQNPDSLSIIFASSIDGFDPIAGSEFFVDDVLLNYGTAVQEAIRPQVNMYPNPSSSILHIDLNQEMKQVNAIDALGRFYPLSSTNNSQNAYDVSGLSNGIYWISIELATGETNVYQSFIKQ